MNRALQWPNTWAVVTRAPRATLVRVPWVAEIGFEVRAHFSWRTLHFLLGPP